MEIEVKRTINRLSDIYALMADMLEDETGDFSWFVGDCMIQREEGGLAITRMSSGTSHDFTEPGAAGDFLVDAECYVPGMVMIGRIG